MISDSEIVAMVSKGELIVSNFRKEQLTPNGYDLTIGEVKIHGETHVEGFVPAKTFFLVSTMERLDIKSGLIGQLWLKSSYCRKGIFGSFGLVDSGFRGELTLALYNASDEAVHIAVGKAIAQIAFMKMSSEPALGYNQRSGNFQDQSGITTEFVKK